MPRVDDDNDDGRPRVIGIVGSRRRDTDGDFALLAAKFAEVWRPGDRVVSGGCPKGADRFAEILARNRGLTLTIHYPDWRGRAGRGAGFVRNTEIARDCDVLIALPASDRKGGTEDTIRKALQMGKAVILV